MSACSVYGGEAVVLCFTDVYCAANITRCIAVNLSVRLYRDHC